MNEQDLIKLLEEQKNIKPPQEMVQRVIESLPAAPIAAGLGKGLLWAKGAIIATTAVVVVTALVVAQHESAPQDAGTTLQQSVEVSQVVTDNMVTQSPVTTISPVVTPKASPTSTAISSELQNELNSLLKEDYHKIMKRIDDRYTKIARQNPNEDLSIVKRDIEVLRSMIQEGDRVSTPQIHEQIKKIYDGFQDVF
jgi:hypothetical protein